MSLALRSPSAAAAAASAARAAPLRACAQQNRALSRSLRQQLTMTTSTAAAAAAAATASSPLATRATTSPRPVVAAAAAAAVAAASEQQPSGRLAERGDMVTVHYTLYEEVISSEDDPSSSSPGPSASSSSSPSPAGGGDAEAAAAPALVVEDPTKKKKYKVLDSSRVEEDGRRGEPLTFEVGAGDVFGNELFQAFDEVVRGRAAGDVVRLTCPSPPAWDPELLFRVPGDHPEVERMRGRYKNVGGLAEGLVVELSNGKRAVVVAVSEEEITLDANDMLAGGSGGERVFELELVRVEEGKKKSEEGEEEEAV